MIFKVYLHYLSSWLLLINNKMRFSKNATLRTFFFVGTRIKIIQLPIELRLPINRLNLKRHAYLPIIQVFLWMQDIATEFKHI